MNWWQWLIISIVICVASIPVIFGIIKSVLDIADEVNKDYYPDRQGGSVEDMTE